MGLRDLHSWLFDKSEKELELEKKIKEENNRYEATSEYIEHEKTLHELYEALGEASRERRAAGRKHREEVSRKPIVIPERTPEEIEERRKKRYDELPEDIKEIITKYNSLARKDKCEVNYFIEHPFLNRYGELSEYKDPITTKQDIRDLQDILVQVTIDFIKERGLTDIDAVSWGADGLEYSAKYGEWTPSTDSSITVEGLQPMEDDIDEKPWPVRKRIGSSC